MALDASGNVLLNASGDALENQKNVVYTIKVTGDAAANYTVNTVAASTGATLTGKGRIKQAPLTVTPTQEKTNVDKYYDTSSDVDADKIKKTNVSITGWATKAPAGGTTDKAKFDANNESLFKWSDLSASYGDNMTDDTFEANANAGDRSVQYKDFQTALKSKNYKISNTAYGKGIIYKASIKQGDLEAATNINNPLPSKVYDGTTNYDDSGLKNSTAKAQQYLTVNYDKLEELGIHLTESDKTKLVYTIAQVIYNGGTTPDVGEKNMGYDTYTVSTR